MCAYIRYMHICTMEQYSITEHYTVQVPARSNVKISYKPYKTIRDSPENKSRVLILTGSKLVMQHRSTALWGRL